MSGFIICRGNQLYNTDLRRCESNRIHCELETEDQAAS